LQFTIFLITLPFFMCYRYKQIFLFLPESLRLFSHQFFATCLLLNVIFALSSYFIRYTLNKTHLSFDMSECYHEISINPVF
jgi:hypothetical protein